jgi:hypothetical protein
MAITKRVFLPETERVADATLFNNTYQTLGTPLDHPSRMLMFVSNSTVNVKISWDGVNSAFTLLAGATVILDQTSNTVSGVALETAEGKQIYVKGATAGAAGEEIYLSTFYAF